MEKIKVAIVYQHPAPYEVPLFDMIAQRPQVALTVYYCSAGSRGRGWGNCMGFSHNHEILPGRFGFNFNIWGKLAKAQPDVVVIAGYSEMTMQLSILYCWLRKIPYIMICESHLLKKRSPLKKYLKGFIVKPIMKRAAANLPTGTKAKEYLIYYGGNAKNMFFFPNAPNVNYFEVESQKHKSIREEIRRSMGIKTRYVIIYVGRLVMIKGCQYLIEAFSEIRKRRDDVSLIIVGDGDFRIQLEEQVANYQIPDVYFLGSQPNSELPRLYAMSDVFVLPSYVEPWGVVVGEAMASGLPVIVTQKVGCAFDIVFEGENGFIVPEKNVESLFTALRQILESPAKMMSMGQRSREIIRRWDYRFAERNFIKAVASAVNSNKKVV